MRTKTTAERYQDGKTQQQKSKIYAHKRTNYPNATQGENAQVQRVVSGFTILRRTILKLFLSASTNFIEVPIHHLGDFVTCPLMFR